MVRTSPTRCPVARQPSSLARHTDGARMSSMVTDASLTFRPRSGCRSLALRDYRLARIPRARSEVSRPTTSSGARSPSGTRTKPRPHMRGWGTTRSGSSTCSSPTRRTSTSRVRGPHRSTPHPLGGGLGRLGEDQELAGRARGPQLDHAVEVGALAGRAADRVGLVHRGDGRDVRQPGDRGFQVGPPVAQVGARARGTPGPAGGASAAPGVRSRRWAGRPAIGGEWTPAAVAGPEPVPGAGGEAAPRSGLGPAGSGEPAAPPGALVATVTGLDGAARTRRMVTPAERRSQGTGGRVLRTLTVTAVG